MTCSCRSSTLRVFVSSIAQIHFPEGSASSTTAWLSRRNGAGLSRAAWPRGLPAAASWSRPLHTTTHKYSEYQEAALPQRNDERGSQDKNAPLSQAEPSFTELSSEAIDQLAAELSAADTTRAANRSPARTSRGRVAQTGRRERTDYTREFAKPRDRPKRSTQARNTPAQDKAEDRLTWKREDWQIQKAALREKFPEGWQPRKKLSPDALAGIRALHEQFPEDYTTEVLANKFEVSPEAIRRILRSKWEPSPEEEERRQERWFNRGKQVWSRWAELGKKPPTRWRDEGIERKPYRRQARDEEEDDDDFHEPGNSRLIARSKLAKNLM